ncbi:MAG: GNAT family N-acetyltransferase [Gaiellaceae bacterium]
MAEPERCERTTEEQAPTVQPVTPERWRDLVALFERKGPRGGTPMTAGCWCMWWRRRTGAAASNRRAMQSLVREGRVPGLLAYEEGEPVGWVSVAPREEFGQLVGSRTYGPPAAEPGVWSIVCFNVDPRAKRRGVATALLDAAVKHAAARGARAIEAYLHLRGDYMGSPGMFAAAGFEPVREAGPRLIVRRSPDE